MVTKPSPLDNIPEQLQAKARWVGWRPDPDTGRSKCPCILRARARRASTRKEDTWDTFEIAQAFYAKYSKEPGHGVGFVFTAEDGFLYIDIDDCLDGTGAVRSWAMPFITPLRKKAYIERSPSGTGLHLITRGKLPEGSGSGGKVNFTMHASGARTPEVAIFQSGKYTTITGNVWKDELTMVEDASAEVMSIWKLAGIKAVGVSVDAGPAPDEGEVTVPEGKLSTEVKRELEFMSAADAPDRSAARFKLYAAALRDGLLPEEVFQLTTSSEWFTASGAAEKGVQHAWEDIVRCAAKVQTAAKEFTEVKAEQKAEAESAVTNWKSLGISVITEMTKAGPVTRAVYGVHNMALTLARHPAWKGRWRRNDFANRIELDGKEFDGTGIARVAEELRAFLRWDREPPSQMTWQAIEESSAECRYNPVQEYLRALPAWDGVDRLPKWLAKAGCEDSALNRIIGTRWWISLIARALRPGCKVDTVLILEGGQGLRKSALFTAIAGDGYFTDSHVDMSSKEGAMVAQTSWVTELAELSQMKRAERETVKSWIASRNDRYRPPFGRVAVSQPRHFVVVGSTNEDQYLSDPTGGRRFWPVRVVRRLDDSWVGENRDRLMAEAVARLERGERWWFEPEDEDALKEAQEERYQSDVLEERLAAFVQEVKPHPFTVGQVSDRLGLGVDRRDLAMRVAEGLKRLGLTRQRAMIDGVRAWRWADPKWPRAAPAELEDLVGGGEEEPRKGVDGE